MDWTVNSARQLATVYVADLGPRWYHVRAVGRAAENLVHEGKISDVLAGAAWLHDIGYSPLIDVEGFHPLDGARFLRAEGAPEEMVSLVAHHSGAMTEAEERGFTEALSVFPRPTESDLDALTLLDMSSGPDGAHVDPVERIAEILRRYGMDSPVHRAVTRSRDDLLAACNRAQGRLGLTNERRGSSL